MPGSAPSPAENPGTRPPSPAIHGVGEVAGRILEDLNVWLNVHDRELRMLVWNRVAEELSGYSAAEVVGHAGVWELCYPDPSYREAIQRRALSIVEEGETVLLFQNDLRCRDGSLRSMSWNSRPFFDEEGRVQGAITVGYDVTELKRLHRQSERLAVLEERARLARELHDAVSQSLYSLTLFAEAGRRRLRRGERERAAECVERLAESAQAAFREMRLLVYELRPLELEREGLVGALSRRLEAVERRTGVHAKLDADDSPGLSVQVEEALYRIAQEALNNALRHASASRVVVSIRATEDVVRLTVEDDGIGFATATAERGGFGLPGMRERAEQNGGRVDVRSTPGRGSIVCAELPLGQEQRALAPPRELGGRERGTGAR